MVQCEPLLRGKSQGAPLQKGRCWCTFHRKRRGRCAPHLSGGCRCAPSLGVGAGGPLPEGLRVSGARAPGRGLLKGERAAACAWKRVPGSERAASAALWVSVPAPCRSPSQGPSPPGRLTTGSDAKLSSPRDLVEAGSDLGETGPGRQLPRPERIPPQRLQRQSPRAQGGAGRGRRGARRRRVSTRERCAPRFGSARVACREAAGRQGAREDRAALGSRPRSPERVH